VPYLRNELALRTGLRILNLILSLIVSIHVHIYDFLKFVCHVHTYDFLKFVGAFILIEVCGR